MHEYAVVGKQITIYIIGNDDKLFTYYLDFYAEIYIVDYYALNWRKL